MKLPAMKLPAMKPRRLPFLVLCLNLWAAGCATPGVVDVTVPPAEPRTDVAVAEVFRVPAAQRKELIKKLVVSTHELRADVPHDLGGQRVALQDAQRQAWVAEFQRAFVREGLNVVDPQALQDVMREQRLDPAAAAKVLAADAVFSIRSLEVVATKRKVDVSRERLVDRAGGEEKAVASYPLQDFYCRIQASLVLASNVVGWSGELAYPASALTAKVTLTYHVDDRRPDGPQPLAIVQQGGSNPVVTITWDEQVKESTLYELPEKLDPANDTLIRVATKAATDLFVEQLFRASPAPVPGEGE